MSSNVMFTVSSSPEKSSLPIGSKSYPIPMLMLCHVRLSQPLESLSILLNQRMTWPAMKKLFDGVHKPKSLDIVVVNMAGRKSLTNEESGNHF